MLQGSIMIDGPVSSVGSSSPVLKSQAEGVVSGLIGSGVRLVVLASFSRHVDTQQRGLWWGGLAPSTQYGMQLPPAVVMSKLCRRGDGS